MNAFLEPAQPPGPAEASSGNAYFQPSPVSTAIPAPRPIQSRPAHEIAARDGDRVLSSSGAPLPDHIQALKIPPAWTDVTYSPDANASLLATGRDSKGRKQSIYSAQFAQQQAQAKFDRVSELNDKLPEIEAENERARLSRDPAIRDVADAMHLIMKTGIRPGSDGDTKAKVKAYGATTLLGSHVVDGDGGMSLQFVGKKGVPLNIPVDHAPTAAMLRERAALSGPAGRLFPSANETKLLAHADAFDGGGFKTKDFRTLLGSTTASELVDAMPIPKTPIEYKKSVMEVAKAVSAKLGNTPTVALQSYINPSVFASWRASS